MTQGERLLYLIKYLKSENPQFANIEIPSDEKARFNLFRSLVNIREPKPIGADFLKVQGEYLQNKITPFDCEQLEYDGDIALWQGDITRLRCDAIVNAANSALLGCFCPCHSCIDNAIHTFSGVELRLLCNEIMKAQGYDEKTGSAKITPAFNLPSKFVIHTVGPIVRGNLSECDRKALANCYLSCLKAAEENGCESIAFCCISTGEFHFPNKEAAEIAVKTVNAYKAETNSKIKVIFNVFKELDYEIYKDLLGVCE